MKYSNPKVTREIIAGFAEVIKRLEEFIQRQDFRSGNYETKSDGSPVGDLDVAIENFVQSQIEKLLPVFQLIGE